MRKPTEENRDTSSQPQGWSGAPSRPAGRKGLTSQRCWNRREKGGFFPLRVPVPGSEDAGARGPSHEDLLEDEASLEEGGHGLQNSSGLCVSA